MPAEVAMVAVSQPIQELPQCHAGIWDTGWAYTSKEKVNEPNDEYMNTNTFKRQNVSPPACCVEVKFPKARAWYCSFPSLADTYSHPL